MRYRCSEIFECFRRLMCCKFDAGVFEYFEPGKWSGYLELHRGKESWSVCVGKLQGIEHVGGSLWTIIFLLIIFAVLYTGFRELCWSTKAKSWAPLELLTPALLRAVFWPFTAGSTLSKSLSSGNGFLWPRLCQLGTEREIYVSATLVDSWRFGRFDCDYWLAPATRSNRDVSNDSLLTLVGGRSEGVRSSLPPSPSAWAARASLFSLCAYSGRVPLFKASICSRRGFERSPPRERVSVERGNRRLLIKALIAADPVSGYVASGKSELGCPRIQDVNPTWLVLRDSTLQTDR